MPRAAALAGAASAGTASAGTAFAGGDDTGGDADFTGGVACFALGRTPRSFGAVATLGTRAAGGDDVDVESDDDVGTDYDDVVVVAPAGFIRT